MNNNRVNTAISVGISIIAIVIAFWAAGKVNVATDSASPTGNDLANIIQTSAVKVCYGTYPPTVIKDSESGELSGVTIDTINYIFKQAGVTPEYVETAWGDQVTAIQAGRCDMSAELTSQVARASSVAFSDPIYYLGSQILGKNGESRFANVQDLNSANVTIAVANGESGHNFAQAQLPNAKLNVISVEGSDLSKIFTEVSSGRADIAIADAGSVKQFALAHPETAAMFDGQTFGINSVGFAVRHSARDLLHFLNTALDNVRAEGTLEQIMKKYEANLLVDSKNYRSAF